MASSYMNGKRVYKRHEGESDVFAFVRDIHERIAILTDMDEFKAFVNGFTDAIGEVEAAERIFYHLRAALAITMGDRASA